ncbi:hypothetical protein PG985_012139 [Apiospora marii]|uniref:uncharacterized protein n=1 Tax=Apiospora marii TaxID=335849 RepID=UPI003132202C
MRMRRGQIAKPLIRPRRTISPPLTNSEGNTSSSDSSDILKSKENKAAAYIPKRSKRCQMPASPPEAPASPPLSPKVPRLSDSQPPSSDNITPASLRDYMMSGRYHDCFLGEEINDIILGEYQAAERWNLGVEQPGVICWQ